MDYDDSEFDLLFEEMDCRLLDADHIFPALVPRIPRTPLTLPPMCSFIREFLFKSSPPFLGRQPWIKETHATLLGQPVTGKKGCAKHKATRLPDSTA